MTNLTLKSVNKAIADMFPGKSIELVKGAGYFYFFGRDVELCKTTSVMVYHLNQLDIIRWMADAGDLLEEHAKREAELAASAPENLIIRRMITPEPIQPQRIDFTPSWTAVMPVIIAALQNGTNVGQKAARDELMRAAAILDSFKEQQEATADA